jgi:HK97 family phage major capsid protein
LINTTPVSTADGSPQKAAAAFQYIPTDSASPQAFGADDVIDLVYALNRGYRTNAKFGANSVTQGALRKLKSSNGDYYWQPSLQEGQPARLLGYPVFTYEDMADYNTADGIYLGFGDWRNAYTLVYRRDLAVTAEGITNPGYIRFYVRRRFGGIPHNNDCLKFLKFADT